MRKIRLFAVAAICMLMLCYAVACGGDDDKQEKAECIYGEWHVDRAASCEEPGVAVRVCKLHGETERNDIPKLDHEWSEWETTEISTCTVGGKRYRVCLRGCGKSETEKTPPDPTVHDYDVWYTVQSPTCSEKGKKARNCKRCTAVEEGEIDIDPDAHDFRENDEKFVASTCSTHGKTVMTCTRCGVDRETELAFDRYAHAHYDETAGICADCGGLLKSATTVDNRGVAEYEPDGVTPSKYKKAEVGYPIFAEGDFELVYEFGNVSGVNKQFHNFIFEVCAAEYSNGELRSFMTDGQFGQEAGWQLIPFHPGDLGAHYGAWWSSLGCKYTTDWFRDANGVDPGFENCMARGVDVTLTVKRSGQYVTVRTYMITADGGAPAEFESTATLNFGGISRFLLRLTGENNLIDLRQVYLKSGTILPETRPDDSDKELLKEETTITNTDKNVDGYSLTLDGDFDIEFDMKLTGNANNDWHSFILYVFKGATTDFTLGNANTLLWNLAANGTESEGYTDIANSGPQGWNWRKDLTDGFAQKLAGADVSLHLQRRNGYLSVIGSAYFGDETQPFVYWRFIATVPYSDTVTVRLTSEESTVTLKSVKLLAGIVREQNPETVE